MFRDMTKMILLIKGPGSINSLDFHLLTKYALVEFLKLILITTHWIDSD